MGVFAVLGKHCCGMDQSNPGPTVAVCIWSLGEVIPASRRWPWKNMHNAHNPKTGGKRQDKDMFDHFLGEYV